MKIKFLNITIILSYLITSCSPSEPKEKESEAVVFENKGHELVYNMVQKVGDYNKLFDKKDVTYTYTYQTPDGKTDR